MTTDGASGLINRRFGEYVALREIGCGAMAQVYLCALPCAPGCARFLAIKCLHRAFQQNADYVRLFYREAEIALSLMHPNIVETWSCGVTDGRHVIVMDYLPGVPLSGLIARGAMPFEVALHIAISVLRGLMYLHEKTDAFGNRRSIIHRDLTPDNIMVGFDGTVRIFDFGVSRRIGDPDDIQKGMMVGKYAYMSPEQCRGEDVDCRSDVFSLAAVLYEMCVGHPAFARDTDIATIDALLRAEIASPNQISWRFPTYLSQCVMRGLERDLTRRYACAREFAEDLSRFVKMQGMHDLQNKCHAHAMQVCGDLFEDECRKMRLFGEAMQRHAPTIESLLAKTQKPVGDLGGNTVALEEVSFSKIGDISI